jgi:hypothetical protein
MIEAIRAERTASMMAVDSGGGERRGAWSAGYPRLAEVLTSCRTSSNRRRPTTQRFPENMVAMGVQLYIC